MRKKGIDRESKKMPKMMMERNILMISMMPLLSRIIIKPIV
jgi:hypothetical protein